MTPRDQPDRQTDHAPAGRLTPDDPTTPRRNRARLHNDPDKYVRPVKGGKFQARPYDDISGTRYDLGLFPTREQARRAILEFWWGRRQDTPRFTRAVKRSDGTTAYQAIPTWGGKVYLVGIYDSRDLAAAAAWGWLVAVYGPLFAHQAMVRK